MACLPKSGVKKTVLVTEPICITPIAYPRLMRDAMGVMIPFGVPVSGSV